MWPAALAVRRDQSVGNPGSGTVVLFLKAFETLCWVLSLKLSTGAGLMWRALRGFICQVLGSRGRQCFAFSP